MSFTFGGEGGDTFHLRTLGDGENVHHLSGAPTRVQVSVKNSPGNPFLVNGTGVYSYGALHFSYLLDAFVASRGALHFSYILSNIVLAEFDSSAAASDAYSAAGSTYESLVAASSAAASDAFARTKVAPGSLDGAAAVAGTFTAGITLEALIESTAAAVLFVRFEGEQYPVWVMNAETGAASRYTNFNFNSFACINGHYFGANDDGLYELEGADDDGEQIPASIMLGRDREGSQMAKRMSRAYLHGTSDKKLQVRVVTREGEVYEYDSELELSDRITVQRVKLGKGLTANYSQIEVRNAKGGAMEIEQIEMVSLNTQRRIARR